MNCIQKAPHVAFECIALTSIAFRRTSWSWSDALRLHWHLLIVWWAALPAWLLHCIVLLYSIVLLLEQLGSSSCIASWCFIYFTVCSSLEHVGTGSNTGPGCFSMCMQCVYTMHCALCSIFHNAVCCCYTSWAGGHCCTVALHQVALVCVAYCTMHIAQHYIVSIALCSMLHNAVCCCCTSWAGGHW